ncbi:NAD(P)H-dependent oxidoreductase [Paracoccus aminophilus]|uniref:Quinone dependent NAD(P)H dehydrogenase n=1 Tax=Paracoccus aminophilus JCM 7686 TaxID=1367847 RepID=S5YPJ3_PARAH|nr:NAD(P)H-dependent oxidoreductase [Paracoccus aminophilus]AGT07231.1 quinone dependent NAD(P)H dehydrogenase [Paracoccus aminophilus JCM 7686]
MKALVIHCHPEAESFTAAVRDRVLDHLTRAGAEIRVMDLYAQGFDPVLSGPEWRGYLDAPANRSGVEDHVAALAWCDTLIFTYPTWWYGLPAMLKGWLDRVLLPEAAFLMPDAQNKDIRPGLTQITRIGVFTTCGASRWLTALVGAPGRRTLLRGVGYLCAPQRRSIFAAHYKMDSSTPRSRKRHLKRVDRAMTRLLAPLKKEKT